MADEGVHEIQLNGKQLVFMFMAVTVVAVVIFLCGVMVGRGVRTPRLAEAPEPTVETVDPTAGVQSPATSTPADATAGAVATPGAPLSSQEKLTYADRLSAPTAPPETLREPIAPVVQPVPDRTSERAAERAAERAVAQPAPIVKTPAALPKVDAKPAAKVAAADARAAKVAATQASAGAGTGFVVQVAAVRARAEADTIAKRLASKGFPSFVSNPGPGAARMYRVRVGKFADRREAESVAKRLEKEEQFKPWITR
jgi:DedD protein